MNIGDKWWGHIAYNLGTFFSLVIMTQIKIVLNEAEINFVESYSQ